MKIILLAFSLLLGTGLLQAAEPAILQLHMDENPANIHPQSQAVGFRILIHRSDGSPISGARLHVHLQAPATPWLASTDFPVVEGTTLLDTEIQVDRGEYAFRFVPPIRGTYMLSASVTPLPGDSSFAQAQQQWPTEISESPHKKRNLAVLLLILLAVGGISGFVLGRSAITAALLVLLLGGFHAAPVEAHGGEQHGSPKSAAPPKTLANDQGEKIELQMLTARPRVGELVSLSARYVDGHRILQPARFRLRVMQLKHQTEVFTTEMIATDGIMRWQGQFYDGSDHRVSVDAVPLTASFATSKAAHAEQDVAVEGVEPPPRAVIKSLGFLLMVTAVALAFGIVMGRFFARQDDFI